MLPGWCGWRADGGNGRRVPEGPRNRCHENACSYRRVSTAIVPDRNRADNGAGSEAEACVDASKPVS